MGRAKEFKEEEVLAKAMYLFWEKGFENVSLKELLDEMGILNGSFYHLYGNKKNLFIAAMKYYDADFVKKRSALFNMDSDFRSKVRIMFNHLLDRQQTALCPRGCFLFNSVAADTLSELDLYKLIRKSVDSFEAFLEDEIRKAVEKKELDHSVDPSTTAALLVTYIQGLMKLSILDYDDKKFRVQTEYFLKSLGI